MPPAALLVTGGRFALDTEHLAGHAMAAASGGAALACHALPEPRFMPPVAGMVLIVGGAAAGTTFGAGRK